MENLGSQCEVGIGQDGSSVIIKLNLKWLLRSMNDTCTCDLVLMITISDTSKNQPNRFHSEFFDNCHDESCRITPGYLVGYRGIRDTEEYLEIFRGN